MKKKLFFIFLAIIFILLLIELTIRLTYKKVFDRYQPNPTCYQPDSLIGFTFKLNSNFLTGDSQVFINNKGFIGRNFSENKYAEKFRICIIGACGVSGVVSYNFYSNFCDILQQEFDKYGWNVEVLNLGIDGNNRSYEIFKTIESKALRYEPDMIIVENNLPFFSTNYTREEYRTYVIEYPFGNYKLRDKARMKINKLFSIPNKVLFSLYDISYTIKAIHMYFWHREYKCPLTENLYLHYDRKYSLSDVTPKYWTIEKSLEMIADLYKKLKHNKTEIFFYSFDKNFELEQLYNAYNLPYVYLFERDEITLSMFYYDSRHFSKAGHKAIGKRFYKILSDGRFIPISYKGSTNIKYMTIR